MDGITSPDVAVIGGGVVGLASALALADAGARVVVIERGACGREASWAGAGIIQCGSWRRSDVLVQLQRESVRTYAAWTAGLRDRTGIDPEFLPCGSFELLLDEKQIRRARPQVEAAKAHESQFGPAFLDVLTAAEARAAEPCIAADVLGALSSRITGQVRNPRLLSALKTACLNAGVSVLEQCEVTSLLRSHSRVRGVRSSGGDLVAGHVILAGGAWSSSLDPTLAALTPVHPVRGQMVLLEARERPIHRVIERGRCYLVPRADGLILVGATQEPEAGFDKRNTAEGISGLLQLAQRLVPCLAGATVVRTWSGLRPGTPDGRPHLGPVPGIEGLIAACGHFRSGLTLAPITARIVTDLVTRGTTAWELSSISPGRSVPAETET